MIRPMRLSELAELVGARLHGADLEFDDVSTDTRVLRAGALYIALQGENFDGNAFVAQAMEKGACAAVVTRRSKATFPQLEVEDTLRALGRLGQWNRRQSRAAAVAITGSQGKTTVKEMTGSILRVRHRVLVTRGNLNNEIGVPLTLLQIDDSHDFAVIELGASGHGEIAYTVALAQPQVVVLNNAAAAHLEGFGSLEGVVEAKGEIIDGAPADGVVVLNADQPSLAVWRRRAGSRTVRSFSIRGQDSGADCYAENIELDAVTGSRFRLQSHEGAVDIELGLPGKHNVANAVAAASAALAVGAGLDEVQAGLAAVTAVPGRLRALPGIHGATIIDDSYNASPASFRAAIDVLAACKGMRVLIVGDMAELGEEKLAAHAELGRYARQMQIDQLWAVGTASELTAQAFGSNGQHFGSHDALAAYAESVLKPDFVALVKGSRSSRMDAIVAHLSDGEAH